MNSKQISLIFIHVIYFVFFAQFFANFFTSNYQLWINLFAIITLLTLLVIVIEYRIFKLRFVSISFIFITVAFLFHLGQLFINLSNLQYEITIANFLKNDTISTRKALVYSYCVIFVIETFVLCSTFKTKRRLKVIPINKIFNLTLNESEIKVFSILLAIGPIIVRAKYSIDQLRAGKLSGYSGVLGVDQSYSGMVVQFSYLSVLGFIALLYAYKSKRIPRRIILLIGIIFYAIPMLSGSRIYSVISILVLCVFYFWINDIKLNGKMIFFCCIIGYLMLSTISIISRIRLEKIITFSSILESFSAPFSVILALCEEFGGSIITVINTIDAIPDKIEFYHGGSYFYSFLYIGFNFNNILNELSRNHIEFTRLLGGYSAYGGSFIGELYYNFGYLGYFFSCIIGIVIGRLSWHIEKLNHERCKLNIIFYVMVLFNLLLWIRGYFNQLVRGITWATIYILLVYYIIRSYSKFRRGTLR